jgi:hypothetical protein
MKLLRTAFLTGPVFVTTGSGAEPITSCCETRGSGARTTDGADGGDASSPAFPVRFRLRYSRIPELLRGCFAVEENGLGCPFWKIRFCLIAFGPRFGLITFKSCMHSQNEILTFRIHDETLPFTDRAVDFERWISYFLQALFEIVGPSPQGFGEKLQKNCGRT